WSFDQLTPPQARLLTALTVFPGGFDAGAATALVDSDGLDAPLLLDDLAAHRLHWRARLRAWALSWARALPATPPLPLLRIEMPNLVAALASAAEDGAHADAVLLLTALRRCLEDVELPAVGLLHAQAAIEGCP